MLEEATKDMKEDHKSSSSATAAAQHGPQDPAEPVRQQQAPTSHTNNNNNPNDHKRPHSSTTTTTTNQSIPTPAAAAAKRPKLTPKRKTNPAVLATRRIIQQCCAANDLSTALQAWKDAQRQGIALEADSYYNLLSLCGGLADRPPCHIGTPKTTTTTTTKSKNNARSSQTNPVNQENATTKDDATVARKIEGEQSTTQVLPSAEQQKQQQDEPKKPPPAPPPPNATESSSDGPSTQDPTKRTEISLQDRRRHALDIKGCMDQARLPLNESAYTALIKLACRTRHFQQALDLLHQAEADKSHCKVKLRMYSTLLVAYCEQTEKDSDNHLSHDTEGTHESTDNDFKKEKELPMTWWLQSALEIWYKATLRQLVLTEREYLALLQACGHMGKRRQGGDNCSVSESSSDMAAAAALVFERVLSDLAQDVLVPSRACSQAICDWYASPAAAATTVQSSSNDTVTSIQDLLDRIRTAQQANQSVVPLSVTSLRPVQHCPGGWTISSSCSIDPRAGVLRNGCLEGYRLRPVSLNPKDPIWESMRHANETIVLQGGLTQHTSAYQGGKKGKKPPKLHDKAVQQRTAQWQDFQAFLQQRNRTNTASLIQRVVVDGANVGYYQQNFQGAPKHLDYHQLDWMIRQLRREGPPHPDSDTTSPTTNSTSSNMDVLVFLHIRHVTQAPAEYRRMIQRWKEWKVLYTTPWGMNDDWFWIQAALTVPGTLLVTNDELRDHLFQMLAPRAFLLWQERHQVHFSFGGWETVVDTDEDGPDKTKPRQRRQRKVELQYPERYSRRIQRIVKPYPIASHPDDEKEEFVGLVIPLPKQGDANRFLDGKHVEGENDDTMTTKEELYICIRVKDAT